MRFAPDQKSSSRRRLFVDLGRGSSRFERLSVWRSVAAASRSLAATAYEIGDLTLEVPMKDAKPTIATAEIPCRLEARWRRRLATSGPGLEWKGARDGIWGLKNSPCLPEHGSDSFKNRRRDRFSV
jgi:hypothetical protein